MRNLVGDIKEVNNKEQNNSEKTKVLQEKIRKLIVEQQQN